MHLKRIISNVCVWILYSLSNLYLKSTLSIYNFYFENFYQIVFRDTCSLFRIFSFILTRIIEHRKSSRKSCHSRGLDLLLNQNDRIYFITTSLFLSDSRKSFECSLSILDLFIRFHTFFRFLSCLRFIFSYKFECFL